jgi:hypothetical protein
MFERRLAFTLDAAQQVVVRIEFLDVQKKVNLYASLAGGKEESAVWTFDPSSKSLQFTNLVTGPVGCILGCLGVSVGKSLLECLLNSVTIKQIEDCLKDKATGALAEAVVCIAGCLGLVP